MSELYMMVTITNRQLTRKFVECYKESGAQVGSVTVGMGTAANEILDYFGLDGMEKSVLFHLVTDAAWRQIKAALRQTMQIDLPGMGIAFIIPGSSDGGGRYSHPCQGHRNRECTAVFGRDIGAGKRNVVYCGKKRAEKFHHACYNGKSRTGE